MKYRVKIEAIIEAPNDAAAAVAAKKAQEALGNPLAAVFFRQQGIHLLEAKVDPKPTRG